MKSDTSERGLETIIVTALVDEAGYIQGDPQDYDRDHAVDLVQLLAFLNATQPNAVEQLGLASDGPRRQQFLHRLQGEITRHGVIHVLRHGVKHGPASLDLFYGTPSPGNANAAVRFAANIFSVTRQLRYSKTEAQLALDLCIFINGLPVITFELKNRLTKQTVEDAVQQYKADRDPRELLFQFGRCVVHLAVDDQEVHFCTHLTGKNSWFLPFNQGYHDGAGNPPNPDGLKTDYLWREVLTRNGLTDILENYAQIVEQKGEKGKKKYRQDFPRYHQRDVVRKLLADARAQGAGRRYLIQHSAGSGKSNSIAWLAHQLIGLERESVAIFDSVIVVTDRTNLDKQIRDTIKQFAQVSATVGHADNSGDLRTFLASGKKIIITTVQKFPFILDAIGDEHRGRSFAIIIDEAHSSQGGRTAAKMNIALAEGGSADEDESTEDAINRMMEGRKMLANASYFAFTATPKNKTLEIFGEPWPEGGTITHRPFHSYTMKQAIQEGFILDVLKHYTPVISYYRLMKKIEDDPEFDARRATKKLRRYVESHEHAIRQKAEIMIDHFHEQVIARQKIGGQARAMVITSGIARAIQYFHAFQSYLQERKSGYKAIVAFSGEHEYGGQKVTEASLNGFPSSQIEKTFKEDPYRFLIVADKFQTGYDEPLLHTMYVDKQLAGIKAVQTLSRLNRAHPQKHDTFVLDFMNDTDVIAAAFADYYRTTVLSEETDPNKLHDLQATIASYGVYTQADIDRLVERYLGGAGRDQLDPILDACVAIYIADLDEDGQVDFKGRAKAFVRTYEFLASILPYSYAEWEKLSIFLNFLIPKLPAPKEEDLAKGILASIDMDSYRVEMRSAMQIALADQDAMIYPVPTAGGSKIMEAELDRLSNILKAFNDQFGNVDWRDADKIRQVITEEIPAKVAADKAYQNAMKNSDKQNARIEHDNALQRVIIELLTDHTELFKQFSDNPAFKRWLGDAIFAATYQERAA
ncbi:MAG: type I restriction endonuclease subunit R [Chloroflexia bacterium]|nr:type I restriction endonuclease subunit R [Chloroflexia bacterium]